MPAAPLPIDEEERLKTLKELHLLDTPLDERFERVTRILRQMLSVPMAAFTLIDKDRQWMKSEQGMNLHEIKREEAFCAHTILQEDVLHIQDATRDQRVADNPFVTGPDHIRFYAGCPIHAPNGQPIGSLCAIDTKPRDMSHDEMQSLRDLASMVETELRATQLSAMHSELIAELNASQRLALVDPLTRIWNRRGIFDMLKRRWSEAARSGEVVVVVMADIDHFKTINDQHGHLVGDAVLQSVARKLLTALRQEDAVGRIGGEEFLLVLKGCEPGQLKRTVERLRVAVATSKIAVPGGELEVTLSFGAAAGTPETMESFEALIKFADDALYSAKRAGRNRVEISPERVAS